VSVTVENLRAAKALLERCEIEDDGAHFIWDCERGVMLCDRHGNSPLWEWMDWNERRTRNV